MNFIQTAIPGPLIVEPDVFGDRRGFFMETYQQLKFQAGGIDYQFVQDNHSHSTIGVLRGLHYQIQHTQGKLLRVVNGGVFDVAVDIRKSFESYGRWVGVTLTAENKRMLWVPPGFAHGYLTLSEDADVLYKATDYYDPPSERCIIWNDPTIGIEWPLDEGMLPVLSAKDKEGCLLHEAEVFETWL